jgi:hypothetical protein
MAGLNQFIVAQSETSTALRLFQHLLELGYIPALHQRLLPLGQCTLRATPSASALTQGPESTPSGAVSASGGAAAAPEVTIDALCTVLAEVVTNMYIALALGADARSKAGDALLQYKGLELLAMEQLLSSPACLKVVLHCGLSAEVQAAARAGCIPAVQCMCEVIDMFHLVANTLWGADDPVGVSSGRSAEEAVRALAQFLNLEENLPYLELLCLHRTSFMAGEAPAVCLPRLLHRVRKHLFTTVSPVAAREGP